MVDSSSSKNKGSHANRRRPGIRRIVQSLGLKCSKYNDSANRGPTEFDDVRVKRLAVAVKSVKADLPPATDSSSRQAFLAQKTAEILEAHGRMVWGKQETREWLLKAGDGVNGYTKDLVYEDEADRQVLEENIILWIKDANRQYKRNMAKKSKGAHTIVDADPEAPSLSPPISAATHTTRSPADAYAPDAYWIESTWLALTRIPEIPYMIFIMYLGFRRKPSDTPEDVVCTLLDEETDKIAQRLWAHLSTEDLFKCAADPDYLVQEIDVLLAEYAPDIWGMDADRSRLLIPLEFKQYQKQLVYKDDDDRKLLWLHIHRWIFAKAFVVQKDKVDSREVRIVLLSRIRPINSHGSAFLVPDRTFLPSPTPHEDAQEPALGSEQPAHTGPVLPYNETSSQSSSCSRLTTSLMAYLHRFGGPAFAEDKALKELELTLSTMIRHEGFGQDQPTSEFCSTFIAWMNMRWVLVHVKNNATRFRNGELKMVNWQHSLLRELNAATNEFLNRRVTISAEELVRLGFGGLQERLDVIERVMNLIREGFEKMNKDWFRLREELSKQE